MYPFSENPPNDLARQLTVLAGDAFARFGAQLRDVDHLLGVRGIKIPQEQMGPAELVRDIENRGQFGQPYLLVSPSLAGVKM